MMIIYPEEAYEAGVARVGGKAFGLAHIHVHIGGRARVPEWFAVAAEASTGHLGRNGHLEEATRILLACADDVDDRERIAAASERLRKLVLDADVDADLRRSIETAVEHLGEGPFAVRSSMVGEDAAGSSFAGQLESFLYRSADGIVDAVRRCWASAFTPHAIAYRLRSGDDEIVPRIAVVVQQMVTGDVSGVAFTADPTSGRRDHTRITSTWGLAEGVVGGFCNTDEFVYDHAGELISEELAEKELMVVEREDGEPGTADAAVADDKRDVRSLSDDAARELVAIVADLADTFGAPQDVEWTIADEQIHILQSRPITALPEPINTEGPRLVFDNSNIQESYCGVTTPLTFSFAQSAYASVYEQTMHALAMPQEVVDEHDDMLRNMISLVRGRVYYNINNWYRGLLLFPSFGTNKADMEAMMGLDVEVDFVQDEELTFLEKLGRLPGLFRALGRLLWRFRGLPRDVPKFLEDFEAAYDRIDRSRFEQASFSELHEVVAQIWREMIENWATPIIGDFYVMMTVGRLRRFVEQSGVESPGDVLNNLMSGEEGIESLEPTRRLMRMARRTAGDDALLEALQTGEPIEAFETLRREHPEFFGDLEDYIERYGDRVIGELKLETITARQDPSFVIQVLRNFATRPDLDPDALAAHEQKLREQAEQKLRDRLGFVGRWRLRGLLRKARTAVKYRENMRLARTRMFGLIRDAYRAMGHRLHEAGRLDHPRDVFYIGTDELLAYQEGRAISADLASLAEVRKEEYARYEQLDLPHHFETVGPVYHGNRYEGPASQVDVDPDAETLQGTGCYPGSVEAPLQIVMSPSDNLDLNGKILTTLRTDPGWAPLFPAASGILVERGSTLSHSAVVARELGIPAVVGVPGLLDVVRDGERVVLDGADGTVQRLDATKTEEVSP